MHAQQLAQRAPHGRRTLGGWMVGILAVMLVGGLIAARLTVPTVAPLASVPADQAAIGQHATVSGLVFDGARYVTRPITIAARVEQQPVIGQAITITAPVFDGTTARTTAIAVGVGQRGYTVTALVDDGNGYQSMPVIVSSR